jgi:putative DNA-invertase from lambdoid prophage Rac
MKALGYIRVSGRSQANDGTGLEEQRSQITAWAAAHGYEVAQFFEDAGVSGELPWDERPAMRALVERLAVNGISAVIVHQLDRIARGKSAIFEDFFEMVQAAGVQVISVVDGLLTDDLAGDEFKSADAELIRTIKQAIVRAEKRKLRFRMELGRMRAKAAGKHTDGVYRFGHDPNRPEEKAALARMRQLASAGLTAYRIGKILDAEGLRPRKAAQWKPMVVQNILDKGEQQ